MEMVNKDCRAMSTPLTLIVIVATTCLAQSDSATTTQGSNNGYLWEKIDIPAVKQVYVTGIREGIFLHSIVTLSKGLSTSPEEPLYPKGLQITDISKASTHSTKTART
jgi:hypothetical protein